MLLETNLIPKNNPTKVHAPKGWRGRSESPRLASAEAKLSRPAGYHLAGLILYKENTP